MKLSKKITAILAPIASVSIVAPIATSCGNKTYEIEFGDDINCEWSKKREDDAPYKTKADVHKAAESICEHTSEHKIKTIATANSERDIQSIYADLVASLTRDGSTIDKFMLTCALHDDKKTFDYILIEYAGSTILDVGTDAAKTDSGIFYAINDDGKHIDIMFKSSVQEVAPIKIRSYRYEMCTVS